MPTVPVSRQVGTGTTVPTLYGTVPFPRYVNISFHISCLTYLQKMNLSRVGTGTGTVSSVGIDTYNRRNCYDLKGLYQKVFLHELIGR